MGLGLGLGLANPNDEQRHLAAELTELSCHPRGGGGAVATHIDDPVAGAERTKREAIGRHAADEGV